MKPDSVQSIEASDVSSRLRDYALLGGCEQVAGWLDDGALATLAFLSKCQVAAGVAGGVAEIGVHHGRSLVALCLLRRPGERAIGIDVFEDQHRNADGSGEGSRERVESHLARFVGPDTTVRLEKADSLDVTPDRVRGWLGGQSVRLFSVDGCHTAEHTASDLILAEAALAPGGIIALDDFDNDEWPSVREGGEKALAGPLAERLEPIVYGNNKLLLAAPAWAARYREALLAAGPLVAEGDLLDVAGAACAKVDAPALDQWMSDADWHRVVGPESGRERFAAEATGGRCRLEAGWSEREAWGVWSDGTESRLLIPVGSAAATIEVRLTYHPYLAPERPRLQIEAFADGALLESWTTEAEGRQSRRLLVARRPGSTRWLELLLVYDKPMRPADLGDPGDGRALAFGLEEVSWRPAPGG